MIRGMNHGQLGAAFGPCDTDTYCAENERRIRSSPGNTFINSDSLRKRHGWLDLLHITILTSLNPTGT